MKALVSGSCRHARWGAAALIGLLLLGAGGGGGLLPTPGPEAARAAFPGKNGRIAFNATNDTGDRSAIFTVARDGSHLRQLTNFGGKDYAPAYSPNGKRIAFTAIRGDADEEIWVMDADGGNPTRLTNPPLPGEDFAPDWSPDGKWIVFDSERGASDIWVMRADGSEQHMLEIDSGYPSFRSNATWQPVKKKRR